MEVPHKTKNRVAIRSSNLTPGHVTRQNYHLKRYTYPYVHSITIHNRQETEATYMSINRGMDKEDVVHTYNGMVLLFSH